MCSVFIIYCSYVKIHPLTGYYNGDTLVAKARKKSHITLSLVGCHTTSNAPLAGVSTLLCCWIGQHCSNQPNAIETVVVVVDQRILSLCTGSWASAPGAVWELHLVACWGGTQRGRLQRRSCLLMCICSVDPVMWTHQTHFPHSEPTNAVYYFRQCERKPTTVCLS